jgi:dipeptidyl aminopeptidase/acylaminoacyl peptidase
VSATRWKIAATAAVALLMITVTVVWALHRRTPAVQVDPALTLAGPGLLVRDTTTGHLAVIDPSGRRRQSPAECARAYAAAGTVLCLQKDPAAAGGYQLDVLDSAFRSERVVPLNGIPTRTRVSADGRMLSFTVFVSGDSYLSSGFSTRSGILDRATGVLATSLEDFRIDGRRPPTDANFWGVSFAADDNTFYATMSTGPHFYLVQGDFAAETITVLDDGVECPSLSPDGSRLAYKKRLPDQTWQLWTYRLDTQERTRLAEPETVDDQPAWRDDATVLYGKADPTSGQLNVWSVPADGSGTPTQVAANAESPAVLG